MLVRQVADYQANYQAITMQIIRLITMQIARLLPCYYHANYQAIIMLITRLITRITRLLPG